MDLGDLPAGRHYEVRIKALNSANSAVFTSPSVALHTSRSCSPPRRPPYDVAVSPLGPTQIRLSWQVNLYSFYSSHPSCLAIGRTRMELRSIVVCHQIQLTRVPRLPKCQLWRESAYFRFEAIHPGKLFLLVIYFKFDF